MCSPDETLALPSRYICIPIIVEVQEGRYWLSCCSLFPKSKALFFPACVRSVSWVFVSRSTTKLLFQQGHKF